MLKEKTKIVEVDGKKYRLTKMDARTGSYVAMKIAMLAAPLVGPMGNKANALTEENIAGMVASLSRNDFDELQTILLCRVQKLVGEDEAPVPIMKHNGVFVDEELEYDVAAVINLSVQCIMFNVGGFFNVAGLMTIPAK